MKRVILALTLCLLVSPAYAGLKAVATPSSISGNAGTATALAANGANCSAGSFPLGVDASGASESCTALSASNAGTATALAANGANCSAGQAPLGVDASGAAEGCTAYQASDADLTALAGLTFAQGDLLYGTGAATVAALAKNTSSTRYLSNTGTSNNPAWAQIDLTNGVTGALPLANQIETYCWAGSDFNTTSLTTGTGVVDEYPFPAAFTVTDVYAYARTAPTGTLTIDINEAGTTIMASTKLTIDANENNGGSSGMQGTAATAAVVSDSAIAANARITADIDGTTGGKGLVVCMRGHY